MHKEVLLEYLKEIRCKSRGKTGADVATECIKLVEEKFKFTNTGSPKLPTLVECERWYVKEKCGFEHITELEKNVIREVHDYICRQLRASA